MGKRQLGISREDIDKTGRGPNIPSEWKQYIIHKAVTTDPLKPRLLLADEILEQMQQSGGRLDKLPERESIAKLISNARRHPKSELDEPWHMMSLANYEIPPEALPAVILIWGKTHEWCHEPLTIREAQWVARLYRVITNLDFLYSYAQIYASLERLAEITGRLPHSNCFFSDRWLRGLLPDVEALYLRRPTPLALPDFEMLASSIYAMPRRGLDGETRSKVKGAIRGLREEIAEVVIASGASQLIRGELLKALRKETQHEGPHRQEI